MTDRLTDFARSPTPSEKSTSVGRKFRLGIPSGFPAMKRIGFGRESSETARAGHRMAKPPEVPARGSKVARPTSVGESRPFSARSEEQAEVGFGQSKRPVLQRTKRGDSWPQNEGWRSLLSSRQSGVIHLGQQDSPSGSRKAGQKSAKGGLRPTNREEPPSGVFQTNGPKGRERGLRIFGSAALFSFWDGVAVLGC